MKEELINNESLKNSGKDENENIEETEDWRKILASLLVKPQGTLKKE